jgi:hypothetical protein
MSPPGTRRQLCADSLHCLNNFVTVGRMRPTNLGILLVVVDEIANGTTRLNAELVSDSVPGGERGAMSGTDRGEADANRASEIGSSNQPDLS